LQSASTAQGSSPKLAASARLETQGLFIKAKACVETVERLLSDIEKLGFAPSNSRTNSGKLFRNQGK
jgi:hypothetical protein